jgi:hypothetical protein
MPQIDIEAALRSIRLVFDRLSPTQQEIVLNNLAQNSLTRNGHCALTYQSGAALQAVVLALGEQPAWRAQELRAAAQELAPCRLSDKQIANAIGYLTRRGHLVHVAYGHYRVAKSRS